MSTVKKWHQITEFKKAVKLIDFSEFRGNLMNDTRAIPLRIFVEYYGSTRIILKFLTFKVIGFRGLVELFDNNLINGSFNSN